MCGYLFRLAALNVYHPIEIIANLTADRIDQQALSLFLGRDRVIMHDGPLGQPRNIEILDDHLKIAFAVGFQDGDQFAVTAYLIDSAGKYVFYIQLTENATYYAAQIDFALTPTSLPSGYTQPSTGLYSATGTGLPTVAATPSITIGNSAFGTVLGLSAATYPASTAAASSQLSNIIPQVHPSSSYVVRCDLVKNDFDVSGEVLAAFNRSGSSIGELVSFNPSEYIWVPAHEGQRSTINISIYDQADRPVHFRDTSVSIMLIFRKARA